MVRYKSMSGFCAPYVPGWIHTVCQLKQL
nr:hypothetical protein [Priestia megaterium]